MFVGLSCGYSASRRSCNKASLEKKWFVVRLKCWEVLGEAGRQCLEARRASGQEPIIGVSIHPDPDQVPMERPAGPPTPLGPMPLRRWAAAFEATRPGTGLYAGSPD